jgi:hypothetical protein
MFIFMRKKTIHNRIRYNSVVRIETIEKEVVFLMPILSQKSLVSGALMLELVSERFNR